jgi:N-acetylglutamate synthase-like GNAT family acetyltransferase
MAAVTFREGGAIPHKQIAALFTALGRGDEVARLDGRLTELLHHSTFVVSAWDGAMLVGAARVVSDRVAVSLVQNVGVHPAYQHHGIGGELLRRCLARFGHTELVVLLDKPADAGFYAHFGFRHAGHAMTRPPDPPPTP